jgi:hypothetical protein
MVEAKLVASSQSFHGPVEAKFVARSQSFHGPGHPPDAAGIIQSSSSGTGAAGLPLSTSSAPDERSPLTVDQGRCRAIVESIRREEFGLGDDLALGEAGNKVRQPFL